MEVSVVLILRQYDRYQQKGTRAPSGPGLEHENPESQDVAALGFDGLFVSATR